MAFPHYFVWKRWKSVTFCRFLLLNCCISLRKCYFFRLFVSSRRIILMENRWKFVTELFLILLLVKAALKICDFLWCLFWFLLHRNKVSDIWAFPAFFSWIPLKICYQKSLFVGNLLLPFGKFLEIQTALKICYLVKIFYYNKIG